jgi:hypothetical protein
VERGWTWLLYTSFSARSSDAVRVEGVSKVCLDAFLVAIPFSRCGGCFDSPEVWLTVVNGATAIALTRHHKQHLDRTGWSTGGD